MKISRDELIGILSVDIGAKPVSIITETSVSLTSKHLGEVTKTSQVNGFLNANYTKSVNRVREKKGETPDFVAQPRRFGTRIGNTSVIEHKGQYYLEVKVEKAKRLEYRDKDGVIINPEVVSPYLRPQTYNEEVVVRTYKIDNIKLIKMNGQTLEVG